MIFHYFFCYNTFLIFLEKFVQNNFNRSFLLTLYVDFNSVSQEMITSINLVWHKIENLMISGQLYISWANNQWVVSKKDGSCSTSSSSLEAAVLQSWSLAQQNQ